MQRYANRAVEEHLADIQPAFDSTWDWRANTEILNKAIDKSVEDVISTRKSTSRVETDSIYAALRSNRAFVDSIKRAWQTIEVGLIIIDPHSGNICAMVGGANFRSFNMDSTYDTDRASTGISLQAVRLYCAIDNGYPSTLNC